MTRLHPLFVLILCTNQIFGFNIDLKNFIKYDGPPRSMFGFSVAAYSDGAEKWVIVGAPEAQSNQPNITNGGVVYKCNVGHSGCAPIPFNKLGNSKYGDYEIDSKSYQWFGATVSSENGAVLACAPRYTWFTTMRAQGRQEPVGTCYAGKKNFTEFSEYSPCRTKNWGYHRQGSCQAGLGAAVSKDGQRLFIGAPGSWYWQGQLYSISGAANLPFIPPRKLYADEGALVSQDVHSRPDVFSTSEGPLTNDDSYLGYSVASGFFHREKSEYSDVVVGVPRGNQLLGGIMIYTWNLTFILNISGEQLGGYFGYSICSGDMDGDSYDDIIVGAPLHTIENNNDWNYENGRIYVYYQGKEGPIFREYHFRDGKNSKARFGFSLAFLGDINKDGYGDLAVGAPYDGVEERGAVYIYHGSVDGIAEEPTQIVRAEDIPGDASTFGFSLAGGVDMDNNLYPDLIIGAYDTDDTFLLKSRPVVKVESSIEFLRKGKQIAIDEKNCNLRDKTRASCVELRTCVKYFGVNVDTVLDFEYQITLDAKSPKNPRMFFTSQEGKNVIRKPDRLDKNQQKCITHTVYLKPNVRDKLTSLDAELKLKLFDSGFRNTRSLQPVLDVSEERTWKDSMTIQKNCGKDNTCIPDLRLIARPNVTTYLLGSGQRIAIEVSVQNEGEDAFEASYALKIPPGMSYVRIVRVDDADAVIPVVCSAPNAENNQTLICDIGNPLPKEKLVQFKVILQPYNLEGGMKPKYEFSMSVNSTNPENVTSVSDNLMKIDLPIWVRTELLLEGTSHPQEIHYTTSQFDAEEITQESEIGPQVIHMYSIRNIGPSDFLEGEVEFLWPSYTLSGEPLLYLLENPQTQGNIQCERATGVNLRNIRLDEKRRRNYFEEEESSGVQGALEGSVSSQGSHSAHSSHSSSSSHSSHSSHSSSHSSSSSSSGKVSSSKKLTAEERKRLESEIKAREGKKFETGDSSDLHYERRHHSHVSSNGGKLESDSQLRPSKHHVYEEETHTVTNSSWQSGKKPVITTSTSWRVNKDGEIRNGSSSNVREGTEHRGVHRGASTRTESTQEYENRRVSGGQFEGTGIGGTYEERRTVGNFDTSRHSGGTGEYEAGRRVTGGTTGSTYEERRESKVVYDSSGRRISGNEGSRTGEYDAGRRVTGGTTGSTYEERRESESKVVYDSSGRRISENEGSRTGEYDAGRRVTGGTTHEERHESKVVYDSSGRRISGNEGSRTGDYDAGRRVTGGTTYEERHESRVVHEGSQTGEYDAGRRVTGGTTHEERHGSRVVYDSTGRRISGNEGTTHEGGYDSGRRVTGGAHEERHESRTVHDSSGRRISDDDSSSASSGGSGWRVSTHEERHESRGSHDSGRRVTGDAGRRVTDDDSRRVSEGSGWRVSTHEEKHESRGSHDSGRHVSGDAGRRVYEDSDSEYSGHEERQRNRSRNQEAGFEIDKNLIGGELSGGKTYKKEWEKNYNMTYTSDGKPITHVSSSWREDQDGKVTSGGGSNVFEGHHKLDEGSHGYNRAHTSGTTSHKEEVSRRVSTSETETGRTNTRIDAIELPGSKNLEERRRVEEEIRRAEEEIRRVEEERRQVEEERRRTYGESTRREESRHHVRGSDKSSESGGYFDSHSGSGKVNIERVTGFGNVLAGPGDGKARTHVLDLGIDGASSARTGSRRVHYSSAESDRRHEEGNRTGQRHEYAASHSSRRDYSSGDGDLSYLSEPEKTDGAYHAKHISNDRDRTFTHYVRSKRTQRDVQEFNCGPVKCIKIYCSLGSFKKGDEALVAFRSRVWAPTIKKMTTNIEYMISSQAVARVTRLPHIGKPLAETTPMMSAETISRIVPTEPQTETKVIPLWIVVLSACAGALILMLLVYGLYKCGFFKRNRPSNAPEKQPLNRNGHYNGDEAL